ncbi:hypothetical protein C2W62_24520 [Candidatus Entotheonella serta]|nr:hypothetical protein C2W62_24520 [Candidatus Entotheonella serta]
MKVRLKQNLVVMTAETEAEQRELMAWSEGPEELVFVRKLQDERTIRLKALGPRLEACREPINVISTSPDPTIRLISNLAHTRFELDAQTYASVEAFWQGLKHDTAEKRRVIAELHEHEARQAGSGVTEADILMYEGQAIRRDTWDHWQLMQRACWAKFTQSPEAQAALLSTENRPLMHRTRRDSRNIPGVIMADIWMRIRRGLVRANREIDSVRHHV